MYIYAYKHGEKSKRTVSDIFTATYHSSGRITGNFHFLLYVFLIISFSLQRNFFTLGIRKINKVIYTEENKKKKAIVYPGSLIFDLAEGILVELPQKDICLPKR